MRKVEYAYKGDVCTALSRQAGSLDLHLLLDCRRDSQLTPSDSEVFDNGKPT